MKYYYIYSDGYEFWDERLKTELAPHFIPVGLKINPVRSDRFQNQESLAYSSDTERHIALTIT